MGLYATMNGWRIAPFVQCHTARTVKKLKIKPQKDKDKRIFCIFAENIIYGGKNMVNSKRRKLPVGVQSFKKIREGGYVYVDKTDIVWELANYGDQYNYLSRPRRFGKSVLVDTLEAYFRGRKELFEGLKIMDMEEIGSNIQSLSLIHI